MVMTINHECAWQCRLPTTRCLVLLPTPSLLLPSSIFMQHLYIPSNFLMQCLFSLLLFLSMMNYVCVHVFVCVQMCLCVCWGERESSEKINVFNQYKFVSKDRVYIFLILAHKEDIKSSIIRAQGNLENIWILTWGNWGSEMWRDLHEPERKHATVLCTEGTAIVSC